jgi:hypothetical protein
MRTICRALLVLSLALPLSGCFVVPIPLGVLKREANKPAELKTPSRHADTF